MLADYLNEASLNGGAFLIPKTNERGMSMLGFWVGMFAVVVIVVMLFEDIREVRKARRRARPGNGSGGSQ